MFKSEKVFLNVENMFFRNYFNIIFIKKCFGSKTK